MKKLLFYVVLIMPLLLSAQTVEQKQYKILLSGASFASSNNGWFEIGCRNLNAEPVNRAIPGEAIVDAANRMAKGTLYSIDELDNIDAFVIMQVHDKDVAEGSQLKQNYKDYMTPFDRSNYAVAYDYVIKHYIDDCHNLKFNPKSKYYNTVAGKPPVIVLSTTWHDSRVTYNTSVRVLAAKWGFPVIEFDKYIGFSKNQPNPVTGEQMSLDYCRDKETIDGVVYAWHPQVGQDKYIQQRMAAIFVDTMKKILPLK